MPADWLTPVRAALNARNKPIEIFFRDDDAGWADERLYALLDCFKSRNMPIDLAVIPQAVSPPLATLLLERWRRNPFILGFHQHGHSHRNHETYGRKCEFGVSRSHEEQYDDLLAGKQRLDSLFGPALDNIFTPPWNRCTPATIECLIELGFNVLSRNRTAEPLNVDTLHELPIDIDWCGIRKRAGNAWAELGVTVAERLSQHDSSPFGIMLHHAVMDGEDLNHLKTLLDLFSEHEHARCRLMRELLETGCADHKAALATLSC